MRQCAACSIRNTVTLARQAPLCYDSRMTKKPPSIHLSVRLPPPLRRALAALARANREAMSDAARRILDNGIRRDTELRATLREMGRP